MFEAEVKDGHVEVPRECPDGFKVRIEPINPSEAEEHDKIGIDESELDDSPEGIEEWIAWMNSIGPVEFREPDEFDEKFRQYNLEAVRKQMETLRDAE